jgi:hypothetical protein
VVEFGLGKVLGLVLDLGPWLGFLLGFGLWLDSVRVRVGLRL